MDPFLPKTYLQWEVEVHYLTDNSVYTDKGILTAATPEWLELRKVTKKSSETFLIPTTAVRIVKVLTPPENGGSSLLRPVLPESETHTLPQA